MVLTYESYDEASDARQVGEVVAGAYTDEGGEPRYFCVPENIDDFSMRMRAFEVRYGKPMDSYQKQVLETAMKL